MDKSMEYTHNYSIVPNKRGTRIKGGPRTNQKISLTGGGGINGTLWQI